MSILDLSKTMMYDFHYNYMKKKYEQNHNLLVTDTYSLMYEINTGDLYRDISENVAENLIHQTMRKTTRVEFQLV